MYNTVRKYFDFFWDFNVCPTDVPSVDSLKNARQTPTSESEEEVHVAGVSPSRLSIGINELRTSRETVVNGRSVTQRQELV